MKRTMLGIMALVLLAGAALATNEITISAFMAVKNGAIDLTRNVNQYLVSQTSAKMTHNIVAVTNDPAAGALCIPTDITTGGYCFFRNVATNRQTLWIAFGGTNMAVKLFTNDVAVLRVASTNIYSWVTNETGSLEYWLLAQ